MCLKYVLRISVAITMMLLFLVIGVNADYVSFTSSGTFTVPAGVTTVYITAWGAGGSGAKLAAIGSPLTVGGGGSGEVTVLEPVTVTPGNSIIVTIGAGGTICNDGCSGGSFGADGGATSFGDLLSVAGGCGGYGGVDNAYSGCGGGGSIGAGRTLTEGTSGTTSGYRTGGSSGGGASKTSGGYSGGSMNGNSGGGGGISGSVAAGGGAAGYGGAGTTGSPNGGSSSAAANSGAGTGGSRWPSNVGTGGSGKLIVYWNVDLTNPTTTIGLSGIAGNNGYFLSNVQVTLTATDNEGGSGIAKTEYSLDNGVNWIQYINPFTISTEGTTTILYNSTDVAGNIEDQKTQIVNIDKTQPASITNLTNITYASTYINWTWTDSSDLDFDRVMIYLNGIFQRNVTNGTQYYNATVLTPNTIYELGTRTVDIAGNINDTWKNNTSTTSPLPVLKVHNINKGTNYSTIQSAIDDANTGDEIDVDSGTYYENVNVNKQLILKGVDMGDGKPIVDGGGITLFMDGIILEGFNVRNCSNGIRVNSNNNVLSYNNVSNNLNGIFLNYSSNNILSYNIVLNNNGIYNGQGIILEGATNNTLSSNTVSNNWWGGIVLIISNNNKIINNSANLSGYGIYLGGFNWNSSNSNTVKGNTVSNNNHGIYLYYSSEYNILRDNIALNNDNGISMDTSSNNIIYNNHFNNTNNVNFWGAIYGNTINTSRIKGINIIGGSYLGGNYWANPSGTGFSQTCIDGNKDGICDTNYSIASGNADYLPLTIPAGYGYIYGTVMNNSIGITGTVVTTNISNTTNTDTLGRYSILVPAGTYKLIATSEPRYYPSNSVTVTVEARMSVVQDIELLKKSTGNITGSVASAP